MSGVGAADQVGVSLAFSIAAPETGPPDDPMGPTPPLDLDVDDIVRAFDGDEPVGHIAAARTDLTVPGEVRLPTAALRAPVVAGTHRGRGALTGMITHLLEDAQQRGQIIATLSSPYSWLHGRLGFGPASEACGVEVDPVAARSVRRPEPGEVVVVEPDDPAVHELLIDVYDRCARTRTGTVDRSQRAWERRLAVGASPGTRAVSEVAVRQDSTGRADAYVLYDIGASDGDRPVGVIRDLWGETLAAERALWAHLVGRPGVTLWRSPRRPVGDPVRFALDDVRAYRVTHQFDELWIRLLDVDVALGTRTYNPSTRALTLKVSDPLLRVNEGTYRVDSYGSFRSQGSPDLELGIDALSAAYLGGTSFRDLVEAGRIVERTPGAAADADTLFGERPTPFCGSDV